MQRKKKGKPEKHAMGSARHGDACYREALHLATFSSLSFFVSPTWTLRRPIDNHGHLGYLHLSNSKFNP
jgi:hypothetical protein